MKTPQFLERLLNWVNSKVKPPFGLFRIEVKPYEYWFIKIEPIKDRTGHAYGYRFKSLNWGDSIIAYAKNVGSVGIDHEYFSLGPKQEVEIRIPQTQPGEVIVMALTNKNYQTVAFRLIGTQWEVIDLSGFERFEVDTKLTLKFKSIHQTHSFKLSIEREMWAAASILFLLGKTRDIDLGLIMACAELQESYIELDDHAKTCNCKSKCIVATKQKVLHILHLITVLN